MGSPPDVSWSPYVWIVLVLVAAFVFVAFRMRTRRSNRVLLAGLAIATIGTTVWGDHAVNVPLDDQSFFCKSPNPSPPSSIVADSIVQECAAGKTSTLPRGQTMAVALWSEWNVDSGTRWTAESIANSNVLQAVNPPTSVQWPANSQVFFEVAVYRANQPGDTTIDAVELFCGIRGCDRGARWWVTIKVT